MKLLPPVVIAGCAGYGLALVIGWIGLADNGTNTTRGRTERTLYVSAHDFPKNADPLQISTRNQSNLFGQLFEGLVRLDPGSLAVLPGAADHWTVSPDGMTYDFHLRPGLRWSDGQPLVAEDFVRSVRRSLDPQNTPRSHGVFMGLRGAADYRAGRLASRDQLGVSSPRQDWVRFELVTRSPSFLEDLTRPDAWPTAPDGPADTAVEALPRVSTNGPFAVESLDERRFVLKRNPYYWARDEVWLERVVILRSTGESALEELWFAQGVVHVTDFLNAGSAGRLAGRPEAVLNRGWVIGCLRMDTRQPPFDDPRVRLALSLAVDRADINARRRDEGAAEARTFVPPLISGYGTAESLRDLQADPRALLASVVAERGAPLPPLTLHFYGPEETRDAAETVAENWRARLGLTVEVRLYQDTDAVPHPESSLGVSMLTATRLDPLNFLSSLAGRVDLMETHWNDAPYDALLARAKQLPLGDERNRVLLAAEERMLAAAPISPLFYGRSVRLKHPSVQGWKTNPLEIVSFRDLRLE